MPPFWLSQLFLPLSGSFPLTQRVLPRLNLLFLRDDQLRFPIERLFALPSTISVRMTELCLAINDQRTQYA